jgi:hypothetical protein
MLTSLSDHAIYMPAISAEYAKIGYSQHLKQSYAFSEADLNFLDPSSKLFHYPYALYSAGQAAKTDNEAKQKSCVSERDRKKTMILGDSGGYQLLTRVIEFEGSKTSERMLRWLEDHADFAMTLDLPTGGIESGSVDEHVVRLVSEGHDINALSKANGLSPEYNACLLQSQLNLNYFSANRKPGATRLLNVIQGRTERESKCWYDTVKGYGLEGWAFAGTHQAAFSLSVARLLDMYVDGYLPTAKWIHFLGISRLAPAYLFTVIQRCLRSVNPEIGISFDTSSPYKNAANFNMQVSFRIDKLACSLQSVNIFEHAGYDASRTLNDLAMSLTGPVAVDKYWMIDEDKMPRAVATAIGSKVKIADIIEDKGGSLRVTTEGVWILMNHNVEGYTQAFRALNRGIDENRFQDQIPVPVREAKAAIEVIFNEAFVKGDVASARSLLRQCRHVLDAFA